MILRKQCVLPLHNSSSSAAVTIGFTTTTYNVTEGGSASVSVSVLSGTLARDVVVTLQTEDGTATGRAVVIVCHTSSIRCCPCAITPMKS